MEKTIQTVNSCVGPPLEKYTGGLWIMYEVNFFLIIKKETKKNHKDIVPKT